jgi:hypothetical protein
MMLENWIKCLFDLNYTSSNKTYTFLKQRFKNMYICTLFKIFYIIQKERSDSSMNLNELLREYEKEKSKYMKKLDNYDYLNISDIIIPFSDFYKKKISIDMYRYDDDIPFKNKDQKFQKIMRKEFLTKEHSLSVF